MSPNGACRSPPASTRSPSERYRPKCVNDGCRSCIRRRSPWSWWQTGYGVGSDVSTAALSGRLSFRRRHHEVPRLAIEEELHVLHGAQHAVIDDLPGHAAIVGREHQLGQGEERIAGWDRLLVKDVEGGARMRLSRTASMSACLSTSPPRAVLMRKAVGFMRASRSLPR